MSSSFGISASGVDAVQVAGQFYTAVCCADGVDIVNSDEKRHVQSLRDCVGALHASWSLRTLHLAVILSDSILIYSCSTSPAALTPVWMKTKSIYFAAVADVNELVSSVSFRYPHVLAVHNREVRLINCRSGSNIQVETPPDMLSMAQLSYTGKLVAVCSGGTRRVEFLEVKANSCLAISRKDHSNEVSFLSWRPGHASERELLLASDVTNLVRIWAVDRRQVFDNKNAGHSAYEAHLLIELGDFVGKPAIFSWLLHGLSTAAETSFLHEHFAKNVKEPTKAWKVGNTSGNVSVDQHGSPSPNGVFSSPNHQSTSGSWLTVLDDRGVLRLLCISPVGVTGHMQCILRGRGPVLKDMPEVLPICGVYALGRFQPNGADKPVAIECVFVFRLNSEDNNSIGSRTVMTGSSIGNGPYKVAGLYAFGGPTNMASIIDRNDNMVGGGGQMRRGSAGGRRGSGTTVGGDSNSSVTQSRRLVRLVSVFTTGPADEFLSVSQNEKEFIVADYNPLQIKALHSGLEVAGDLRKRIADFMLPSSSQSGWRLETWETYSLGSGGANCQSSVVPKSFRALSSPWVGTEAALWCYAHRHKNKQYQPEVVGSLASLQFQPVDVTAAGMGFELTHDILRALWLAAPQQSPPSADEIDAINGISHRGKHLDGKHKINDAPVSDSAEFSANVPILVTLQQKQLGSYVVAIWAIQQSSAGYQDMPDSTRESSGPIFGGQIGNVGGNPTALQDGSFVMGLKRNESKHKYNSEGPSLSVGMSAGGVDHYEVSISPDPHFGLGLRLDVADGVVVVESFKRNPLTMKMMPAEESGIIGVGDELISVNSNELKGHSLADVIQIIRIVVQNARGSAVVLKFRGKNKVRSSGGYKSPDDSITEDAAERVRMISTAVHGSQPGWYSSQQKEKGAEEGDDGATDGQGGYYDPSASDRLHDDGGPQTESSGGNKSWQLELSHAFDDCIAVDIVLGGYGEALSRGDLWTASSGDILAICVALRRIHGVEGSELELSVHEIVYDLAVQSTHHKGSRRRHSTHGANGAGQEEGTEGSDCRYKIIHVGTIPWLGPTPYVLQAWRTGALSFSVSTSTAGGIMTMCTIECLRTWDRHRKDAWSSDVSATPTSDSAAGDAPQRTVRAPRVVSYNYSTLDISDWSISESFCLKLSVDGLRLNESTEGPSATHQSEFHMGREKVGTSAACEEISVASIETAHWIPICCPLLGGRRAVVFGNPGGASIMVAVLRSTNGPHIGPTQPQHSGSVDGGAVHMAGVPVSRRIAVANAIRRAATLEVVQVVNVPDAVKWAQWLDGYSFQVSTGSEWILFSRKESVSASVSSAKAAATPVHVTSDPHEIDMRSTVVCSNYSTDIWNWEQTVSAPFGCTDRPSTMSTSSVEQPSTVICGAVLSAPNKDKRGMLPSCSPDWNPLEIAFQLFEPPSESVMQSGVASSLRRLAALALRTDATLAECFDTIVSVLTPEKYPQLFQLEHSAGLSLSIPECSAEMVDLLCKSLQSTAKGIALASNRKQNNSQLGNLAINMLPVPFRTLSPTDVVMMASQMAALLELVTEGRDIVNAKKQNDDSYGAIVGNKEGTTDDSSETLTAEKLVSARFGSLDHWARTAIIVNKCMCAMDSLKAKPDVGSAAKEDGVSLVAAGGEHSEEADGETHDGGAKTGQRINSASDVADYSSGDQSIRVCASFVANAMVSSSQRELYDEFIGDVAKKLTEQSIADPDSKERSKLHFGMLWWARNSVGKEAGQGEFDVLRSLAAIMTPMWLHDFTPLLELIESVATQQFKHHRDSMKVFLEMVIVGKTDKLMLLSKTDKNVMGKQLKSLLSIDFASEKGRMALHKNAFALLRLQRYRHAVAVFLCAEPPMLREAVRIVVKHLNDPFLALLITRLVEHRKAIVITGSNDAGDSAAQITFLGHPGGYVLGPVARHLLESEIVPGLCASAKLKKTDTLATEVISKAWGVWGGESTLLLGVCAQWLQDVSVFRKMTRLGRSCGYFAPAVDCSAIGKAKQLLSLSSSLHWILAKARQFALDASVNDVVFELDAIFDQLGVPNLRLLCRKILDDHQHSVHGGPDQKSREDAFILLTEMCLRDWKQNRSRRVAALKSTKLAVLEAKKNEQAARDQISNTVYGGNDDKDKDDEFDQALSKLNKLKNVTKVDNTIAVDTFSSAPKKGFNFAASSSAAAETVQPAPSMLDSFGPPTPRKAAAAPPSMLDMFDVPPPRAKPKPSSEPANMLDMFDSPPPVPKKVVASEPANMLDMFDAPPPRAKPKPSSEPANMLDMFDSPPPVPKKVVTSEPANMLDMFDAPPAKPKIVVNDAPPPQAKKAIPAAAQSALDMFDMPGTSDKHPPTSVQSTPVSVDDDEEVLAISTEQQADLVRQFHDIAFGHLESTTASDSNSSTRGDESTGGGCCATVVHTTSEYLMETRCIAELIKVLGCPTMGHPWAVSGNVRGLVDVALGACTRGRGDEKIRLMAFRCCLSELANKFAPMLLNDIRVAKESQRRHTASMAATNDAPEEKPVLHYILCARLLEYLELRKSLDCMAVRVLLCWAARRAEEARRILLGCTVAVFEASPQCADFSDLCDSPVLRLSRQCFMLCVASNLELLLTMNSSPITNELFIPACRMSSGLVAVVAYAVRTSLTFGCLDHRYDLLLKLLKHPPKFRVGETSSSPSPAGTPKGQSTASDSHRPISQAATAAKQKVPDHGYHYLKRVSRAEAIALLQGHEPGTFLIRPHDTQSEVLFLSFLSSAEEGVKHAIIRRELYVPRPSGNEEGILEEPDTGRRHHQYRCGKIGPCKTLDETLRNISLILPCRLLFTENVAEIMSGEGLNVDKASGVGNGSSAESAQHRGEVDSGKEHHHNRHSKSNHHQDGGFVSRVDRSFHDVKHQPAMSLLDISWNPNAEFWWESVHDNKKGREQSTMKSKPPTEEATRQSMLAALHAEYLSPNQIDDYVGNEAETHMAERNRQESFQNVVITRGDATSSHNIEEENIMIAEDGTEEVDPSHHPAGSTPKAEPSITVALNRREQRRGNEDRGWGSPMRHKNIGGMIRGVIQLLTVKTLYKQLCGQMESVRKMLCSSTADKQLDQELRTLIHLKLANRLPVTMLPKNGPEQSHVGSIDSGDGPIIGGIFSVDASKHSTMHSADGFPLSSIDYLLFPLALFGCVSERAMMSALCPSLPLDPATLTSPKLLSGEQLAQNMLSEKHGVPMNIAKIPHSALGSHLGFVVAHTSNSVSHSAPSVQDQVVECFDLNDGIKWVNEHIDSDALNTVLCYISSTDSVIGKNPDSIPDASSAIKWLWKKGFLQNIVIGNGSSSSSHSNSQIFYRYVDPWEVSVVTDQTAVLASCRLGRLWLGPVSAYGASGLVEVISNYLRDAHERETAMLQLPSLGVEGAFNSSVINQVMLHDSFDTLEESTATAVSHLGDRGFMRLWETLRAEAWLVMCISSATDQPERETGGPDTFVEANVTGLSAQDPYHRCISRYLYRNALFKRVMLPHRFVAMIQVDTFVLKDLAPHKFKAGVVSAPIEVYGVLRLIRSGGGSGVKKSDALKKGSCDIVVTPSRRAETAKSASTSQPSEYLWREQAVLRYPLPESILSVDPFCDDDSRYLRQPPRKLQLSVYETRSIFGDQKLGDLELPLSALTDDRPLREWLPLTSEKGSAWFIRIQLQLRFLLMAHDADRATDPESSTIRSEKGKVKGDKNSSGRSSIVGRGMVSSTSRDGLDGSMGSHSNGPHKGPISGRDADLPSQPSPLDRFRATASVMYESALTEAAALGHAGNGAPNSRSASPRQSVGSRSHEKGGHEKKDSVLGELGDFF